MEWVKNVLNHHCFYSS